MRNGIFSYIAASAGAGQGIDFKESEEILYGIINFVLNKGLTILLIALVMGFAIKFGKKFIDKIVENQKKSNISFSMDSRTADTFGSILKSVLKYVVYFFGITAILSVLFGQISLTLAGIGGVALGLGAQSLIKDFINGFFILFENQFVVGDYVTIGKFSGIVQNIGIRMTVIKDLNGDIHSIPNGTISEVTNHSREKIRFIVEVPVAFEENLDNAIEVIEKCCREFENNQNKDIVLEEEKVITEILGVSKFEDSAVIIKVAGRTPPMTQWKMEYALRKQLKEALDRENIEIPYNKTEIFTDKNYSDKISEKTIIENDKSLEK